MAQSWPENDTETDVGIYTFICDVGEIHEELMREDDDESGSTISMDSSHEDDDVQSLDEVATP